MVARRASHGVYGPGPLAWNLRCARFPRSFLRRPPASCALALPSEGPPPQSHLRAVRRTGSFRALPLNGPESHAPPASVSGRHGRPRHGAAALTTAELAAAVASAVCPYVFMIFRPALRFFTGPRPPRAFAARFFAAVILPPLLFFTILSDLLASFDLDILAWQAKTSTTDSQAPACPWRRWCQQRNPQELYIHNAAPRPVG